MYTYTAPDSTLICCKQHGQSRVTPQLVVQLVVLVQSLVFMSLQTLLQDGNPEHTLLTCTLILLFLLCTHLIPVTVEVLLSLGQRTALFIQASL